MIRASVLLVLGLISGCSSFRPSFLWNDCPGSGSDRATSRAAACMTEAAYEIAAEKAETRRDADPSTDKSVPDEGEPTSAEGGDHT